MNTDIRSDRPKPPIPPISEYKPPRFRRRHILGAGILVAALALLFPPSDVDFWDKGHRGSYAGPFPIFWRGSGMSVAVGFPDLIVELGVIAALTAGVYVMKR